MGQIGANTEKIVLANHVRRNWWKCCKRNSRLIGGKNVQNSVVRFKEGNGGENTRCMMKYRRSFPWQELGSKQPGTVPDRPQVVAVLAWSKFTRTATGPYFPRNLGLKPSKGRGPASSVRWGCWQEKGFGLFLPLITWRSMGRGLSKKNCWLASSCLLRWYSYSERLDRKIQGGW